MLRLLDHDDTIVHGILTENNLFDGSILTPTENYYIEPASRYSNELTNNGIHTIVYKTSDVHILPHQIQQQTKTINNEPAKHYCASQRLYEKMMNQQRSKKYSNKHTPNLHASNEFLSRNKRWLAKEVGDDNNESRFENQHFLYSFDGFVLTLFHAYFVCYRFRMYRERKKTGLAQVLFYRVHSTVLVVLNRQCLD